MSNLDTGLTENKSLPEERVTAFVYRGGSMLGTFRAGDRLIIERVTFDLVQPGDVIAFSSPDQDDKMESWAHRVIKKTPAGLLMRGDNNLDYDGQLLTAGKLIGRVTHVECNRGVQSIRGGALGLIRARILWSRIHLKKFVVLLGRLPYGLLRKSRIVPCIWRPKVTQVVLETEKGEMVKFVCRGRTVASWWPETRRFECLRPYDLVIRPPETVSIQAE